MGKRTLFKVHRDRQQTTSITRCSGHSQRAKLNKDEWVTFLTDPPSSKIRFYALHPLPIQTLWECSFTWTAERRFKGRPSRSTEHGHKLFTRQNSLLRTPARKWLLPLLTLSSTSTRKASFSQGMVSLCCSCRGRSPLPFQQGYVHNLLVPDVLPAWFCWYTVTDKLVFTVLSIFKFRYTELLWEAEHYIHFFSCGKVVYISILKEVFIDLIEIRLPLYRL